MYKIIFKNKTVKGLVKESGDPKSKQENRMIELDDVSLYDLLLRLPYYSVLNYCKTNKQSQLIFKNVLFWKTKAMNDFGKNANSEREYFEIFDKIDIFDKIEIDHLDAEKLINNLIEYIRFTESSSNDKTKLYIAGFINTISKFEIESINLRVGALAKKTGFVLLFLAQIIYDDNPRLLYGVVDTMEEELTVTNFINFVVGMADDYGESYDLNKPIKSTVQYYDSKKRMPVKEIVTNTIDNMDIWTLERVEKQICNISFNLLNDFD